jgi:hypothetical protein
VFAFVPCAVLLDLFGGHRFVWCSVAGWVSAPFTSEHAGWDVLNVCSSEPAASEANRQTEKDDAARAGWALDTGACD